jgi:hypothetical protein
MSSLIEAMKKSGIEFKRNRVANIWEKQIQVKASIK